MGPPVLLAPGVMRVPTMPSDLVNSFLLRDEDGQVTLVDTGYRTASRQILAALSSLGAGPSDVTRILLTHSHNDHTGSLGTLAEATGARVGAHADDAADIAAGRTTPPPTLLGRLLAVLPGGQAHPVDDELHDGQVLPIAGGLQVVHTPGHTPGHVSLLHLPSQTLITGDAIWNMRSTRTWPVLAICTDAVLTQRSAQRLADLEYTTAAFTHGPEIRGTGREAIRSFLTRPRRFGLLPPRAA